MFLYITKQNHMSKSGRTAGIKRKEEKSEQSFDWFSFFGSLYVTDSVSYELQSKDIFARALKANVPIPTLLRHLKRLEAIEMITRRVQTSDLTVYYRMDVQSYFLLSSLEFRELFISDSLTLGYFSSGMEVMKQQWEHLFELAMMEQGAANKLACVDIYIDYVAKQAMRKFVTASPKASKMFAIPQKAALYPGEHGDEEKRKYRISYAVWWTLEHSKKMLEESKHDAPTFLSEVCEWFNEFRGLGESDINQDEEMDYIFDVKKEIEKQQYELFAKNR